MAVKSNIVIQLLCGWLCTSLWKSSNYNGQISLVGQYMSEQNTVVDVTRDSDPVTKDGFHAVSQSLQINASHHDIVNWLIGMKTLTRI